MLPRMLSLFLAMLALFGLGGGALRVFSFLL